MKDIQQLIKKENNQEYKDIYPKTYTDAVLDKHTGANLADILNSFNMYFIAYAGSKEVTRVQVPTNLRRKGLWITYIMLDDTIVTEYYNGSLLTDDAWQDSANWVNSMQPFDKFSKKNMTCRFDNFTDKSTSSKLMTVKQGGEIVFSTTDNRFYYLHRDVLYAYWEVKGKPSNTEFQYKDFVYTDKLFLCKDRAYVMYNGTLVDIARFTIDKELSLTSNNPIANSTVTKKINEVNADATTALTLARELKEEGRFQINGNVTNNPDEEDITVEENKLKFKDKNYNAGEFSGLGRVYLRKNIVNGKNVLTQEMINKPNTIYIIQYDYDLDNEEINIPENCTLEFQGGSLNNGILNGNNTNIKTKNKCFKNIKFKNISYLEFNWVYDNLSFILNNISDTTLFINNGVYSIDKEINLKQGVIIYGEHFTKIQSNFSINMGWRTEIYNLKIDFNCEYGLIIDNTKISKSIIDTSIHSYNGEAHITFVGIIIKNCNLNNPNKILIYCELNDLSNQSMWGIDIINNKFQWCNLAIFFNNITATKENWITTINIIGNKFLLITNGVKFIKANDIKNKPYFTGVNIIENILQWRNADYFFELDGVYHCNINNNMPWDAEKPYIIINNNTCNFIKVNDIFPNINKINIKTNFDKLKIEENDTLAIIFNNSNGVSELPLPINNIEYTPIDFIILPFGNYNINNVKEIFTNQFTFLKTVTPYTIYLEKKYLSIYVFQIHIKLALTSGSNITTYNQVTGEYIFNMYSRLDKIPFDNLYNKINEDVFKPFYIGNNTSNIPAYFNNYIGCTFLSKFYKRLGYINENNKLSGLDGFDYTLNRRGLYNDRPKNLKDADKGFKYYSTDTFKELIWNGDSWVDFLGNSVDILKIGTTAQRPTGVQIGFTYKDTDLNKWIIWNGEAWENIDGTALG